MAKQGRFQVGQEVVVRSEALACPKRSKQLGDHLMVKPAKLDSKMTIVGIDEMGHLSLKHPLEPAPFNPTHSKFFVHADHA